MLHDQRNKRLEHVQLGELVLRLNQRELRQELAERRQRRSVEVDAGERVPKRGRERNVRKVPLELRAARASDPDVF